MTSIFGLIKVAALAAILILSFSLLYVRRANVSRTSLHIFQTPPLEALRVTLLNSVALDYSLTYKTFSSRGYASCPSDSPPRGWLFLTTRVSCRDLFQGVVAAQTASRLPEPPRWLSVLQRREFLLDGNVELHHWYQSEVYNGNPEPLNWTESFVDEFIDAVGNRRESRNYGDWAHAMYNALDAVDIKDQRGLVVGSETPWVEAAALFRGAAHVTTSEYREIIATHPRVSAFHPRQLAEAFLSGSLELFDFAASYSSIEHSGLGRYGDPIDPQADLREVEKVSCLVKPHGLFLLGVPMNNDALVYNVHRLYGPMRLPMLTANWEVISVHSKDLGDVDMTPVFFNQNREEHVVQLAVVLQNRRETPCS